jgi:predicted nucleic acid-binding protein
LNGKRGRREFVGRLIREGSLLACCPVNITEVYAGLRDHERPSTGAFLSALKFYPVTTEIAKAAGLLKRDWAKSGQTLSFADVTLAAVAIENQLGFLTDNRKHFPMRELMLYPLPEVVPDSLNTARPAAAPAPE